MSMIKQLVGELKQATKECPHCKGQCWIITGYNEKIDDVEDRPCPRCKGRGYILTEEAETLVVTLYNLTRDIFCYNPWKGEYEICE